MINDSDIYTIDQISALMYIRHISLNQMAKTLGICSSRLHAMFKYKDEAHNKLLRIACTWALNKENNITIDLVPIGTLPDWMNTPIPGDQVRYPQN